MKVDFFSKEYVREPCRTDKKFGIIDLQPARTTTDKTEKWTATVNNRNKKSIQFIPIDHNIPLYNRKGSLSKRCDGMLFFSESWKIICFVELKAEGTGEHENWIKKAVGQLKNTICHFKANHPGLKYDSRVAYVCSLHNYKIPQPISTSRQKFEDQTGYLLNINHSLQFF
jgi:hypothetical protein